MMTKLFQFGLLFAAFCSLFARASAAEESETRVVAIDARVVRVKLDGVIDVKMRQGDTPSLRITGDKRDMEKLNAAQTGDTLYLDSDSGRGIKVGRSGARAELTLPSLREVVCEGVGTTDISGFSGDELALTMDGAGSMKAVVDYKVLRANLGGVGKMHLLVGENESVELDLRGAGYITLGGRSKLLKATLGGLGGLNAQQFQAESVEVDLSGLGNATVHAKANATLNLSGLGSVIVYGKPLNRNVTVDGLGKVSWK